MNERLARVAYVQRYLLEHFGDRGVVLDVVPAVDWYQYIDQPQGRYGWNYPQWGQVSPRIFASPEVITHQTMWLDMGSLTQYLHTITWMCDRYSTLVLEDPGDTLVEHDPLAVQRQMESELYDLSPETLDLFSRVQLSVLDA